MTISALLTSVSHLEKYLQNLYLKLCTNICNCDLNKSYVFFSGVEEGGRSPLAVN